MKVLPDTNVLVAAFISHRSCHEFLEHCFNEHQIVSAQVLFGEFLDILTRKFGFTSAEVREARQLIRWTVSVVQPMHLETPVCRDPDDDSVLEAAVGDSAACIVTADKDLLVLGEYRGLPMTPPRAAETLEVASKYDIGLKASSHPPAFVAAAFVGLRGCANFSSNSHFPPGHPPFLAHPAPSTRTSTLSRISSTSKASHIRLRMPGQILSRLAYFAGVKEKCLCGSPIPLLLTDIRCYKGPDGWKAWRPTGKIRDSAALTRLRDDFMPLNEA